jgi:hypothetical protein
MIATMDIMDIEADQIVAQHGPFILTPTGVLITGTPAFEEWHEATVWAQKVEHASPFWIGDLLAFGEQAYGEKYAQAVEVTGCTAGHLMNVVSVAQKIPAARRRQDLSYSHHAEVASLPEAEQEIWLDRAEAEALTVKDLRHQVHVARAQASGKTLVLGVWVQCADVEDQQDFADQMKAAGRMVKMTSREVTNGDHR